MALEPATKQTMQDLARSAFTGEPAALIEAPAERIQVYHELVGNIFSETLQQAFPLASAVLGAEWSELVKGFLTAGPKTSPQLWRMPQEFAIFVTDAGYAEQLAFPWLDDLLAFEWMEIELHMMPDGELSPDAAPPEDVAKGRLRLNPDLQIHAFDYPVFQSLEKERLSRKGSYFLLGFRHRKSGKVHFVSLSPLMVLAIEALRQAPAAFSEIMQGLRRLPQQGTDIDEPSLLCSFGELAEEGMIFAELKEEE